MHYKSSHLDYQCSTIIFDDGNIAIVIVIKQGYTNVTDLQVRLNIVSSNEIYCIFDLNILLLTFQ